MIGSRLASIGTATAPVRPYVIGGVVAALVMTGVGFVPLFGGPGYEQALACGLVLPTVAAVAAAIDASSARAASAGRTPLGSLGRGLLGGAALVALAIVITLLHAVRAGICELWGALLYMLLTAGAGTLMGGAWGSVVGEAVAARAARRANRARVLWPILLALAGPFTGIALSIWRFWSSPMIFAFDPFVGYFSGTLYDTVIDAGNALLTYRLGSLATLVALALAASVLERAPSCRAGLTLDLRTASSRARAGLGFLAGTASLGLFLAGGKLGHVSTSASIAKDLGAEKHGARCDVVYPSTTREQEANLLVKDCDEQVAWLEKRFGQRGPQRIRAFFFRDAEDKKRLMGAAHTYIAKPWREEVYLQLASYPHPVLGHELAHVLAGAFGRGPFRIAGAASGLLPNPGLIEGVASFASPDDDDLTDLQWARAMMDIGILPPMDRVFSLRFLGDASSKSYTLAGAFIDWIAQTRGMDAVRAWYGGASLEELTGATWGDLDRAFREHLRTLPLPAEAESFARAKFQRPGIFRRKCPHLVDALRREADVCRDSQRFDEAIRTYREVLLKDDHDYASRQSMGVIERRHGDRAAGIATLSALANGTDVPRTYRDRAEEALADADFIDGEYVRAASRYDALASRSLDEDSARTLEVKSLGARDERARAAVKALLLGDEKRGSDVFLGGVELGGWDARTPSPLAEYLIGRNLVGRGFFRRGATLLDSALDSPEPLPSARIAREALRQRAVAACAEGDGAALDRVRARLASEQDPYRGTSGGRRDFVERIIGRCSVR